MPDLALVGKALKRRKGWRDTLCYLHLAFDRPIAAVRVPHARLRVDLRDRGVGRRLFIDRAYDTAETTALARLVPPGGVVIDIGANLGYYTTLFAQTAGHVYACEPAPHNLALLRANTAHLPHVTVIDAAIGDERGTLMLYLSEGNYGDHRVTAVEGRQAVPVRQITIDSLNLPRVDVIKIDVQGWEVPVLRGLRETWQRNPQAVIAAEYWPEGLQQAGVTPLDYRDAFGTARFSRLDEQGREQPVDRDWFTRPYDGYETLIARHQ
jgi:FkbM family methyltransferase